MHNIETKKGNNLLPQINNGEKMVAFSLASLFCGKWGTS
jgi:hypothetical protein